MQMNRHFGVGYVVDLVEASPLMPNDVTGQFIQDGHGNSNLLDGDGL